MKLVVWFGVFDVAWWHSADKDGVMSRTWIEGGWKRVAR